MKTRLAVLAAVLALGAPAIADEYVIELVSTTFRYDGQSNGDIDLTIRPGDSVRWVWVSGTHNVVSGLKGESDAGDLFRSGDPVAPPMEFVYVFDEAGDFPYHCHLHDFIGMRSVVAVRCGADFNGDLVVNTLDVLAYLNAWAAGDPAADYNGDGVVNTLDILAFLNAWGSGC